MPYPTEHSTYSSPADLIRLGEQPCACPCSRRIAAQHSYHLAAAPGHHGYLWQTTNEAARLLPGHAGHQDRQHQRRGQLLPVRGAPRQAHPGRRAPAREPDQRRNRPVHRRQETAELGLPANLAPGRAGVPGDRSAGPAPRACAPRRPTGPPGWPPSVSLVGRHFDACTIPGSHQFQPVEQPGHGRVITEGDLLGHHPVEALRHPGHGLGVDVLGRVRQRQVTARCQGFQQRSHDPVRVVLVVEVLAGRPSASPRPGRLKSSSPAALARIPLGSRRSASM